MRKLLLSLGCYLMAGGCTGKSALLQGLNSTDPTERGLTCVAVAILIAGMLRAIFSK